MSAFEFLPQTAAAAFSALGWRLADRLAGCELRAGSMLDVAYRLRENPHPEFGGLELEIVDIRPAEPQSPSSS
jgi:single-stranded-DNA-specific exonuclease